MADKIVVVVVRIVGGVVVELPVPCIGPDGFPPVEIDYAGIPDFEYYCYWMVAAVVVVVVAVYLLFLRIPDHVVFVLEPIELLFVSSNPPWLSPFVWK
jgi:hypothetical protein